MDIVLVVIVVIFAAFMFYSSRKRKRQQETLHSAMVPGAYVMLGSGLYGTLISINEEKNTAAVEVAPGTVITVHRQALSRVADEILNDETEAADAAPETIAPAPVAELNGEPIYGERVQDPAETQATKRTSQD
jgi:preprotein translocase subunit YajC